MTSSPNHTHPLHPLHPLSPEYRREHECVVPALHVWDAARHNTVAGLRRAANLLEDESELLAPLHVTVYSDGMVAIQITRTLHSESEHIATDAERAFTVRWLAGKLCLPEPVFYESVSHLTTRGHGWTIFTRLDEAPT